MFDVGFSELCLVGLVSLLVIGPEKLPQVARFIGFWMGKMRHTVASVKQEFQEELYAEEVRQLLKQQTDILEQLEAKGQEYQTVVAEEVQQLQTGFVKTLTNSHQVPLPPESSPATSETLSSHVVEASPVPTPLKKRPKTKKHRHHGKR